MSYRKGVWKDLFSKIINAHKVRKEVTGTCVGEDEHGNKFFETPAEPSKGRRHPTRWFDAPPHGHVNYSEMFAEWDSWLRHRRDLPPSLEEIEKNKAIASIKKIKGDIIEQGNIKIHANASSFPAYSGEDYERTGGQAKKPKK